MKFLAISDTHGKHTSLRLPEADMIIHAGDISGRGNRSEILYFLEWFESLPYRYKLFIAGNHDFYFEKNSDAEIFKLIPDSIIYLNDTGIELEGIHIWGSPITPWFNNWAFNRNRGMDIRTHWDMIPAETDILVTHGPPLGKLDQVAGGLHTGCADLLQRVEEVQPAFHIFGHIHEGYGLIKEGNTSYINASVLNERYSLENAPVIFEYNKTEL
ncbi:MAG: metallophosphatase domain-containing protein [Bacteroidetes bacterium]|nr:metallophosphatase domain-containing protein [Bacteroidota bacterium]